jgi:hypothetical protein
MTRLEIYKECVAEFNLDPEIVDEYVVSKDYNPLIEGDPDEEVSDDDIAEIRAEWMPLIADWVNAAKRRRSNFVLPRTGTAMTTREIYKQVSGEFSIKEEFTDRIMSDPDAEARYGIPFDEELSEEEAKHCREVWTRFFANRLAEATSEPEPSEPEPGTTLAQWITGIASLSCVLLTPFVITFVCLYISRGNVATAFNMTLEGAIAYGALAATFGLIVGIPWALVMMWRTEKSKSKNKRNS